MKYQLDEQILGKGFNAGLKARLDCLKIMQNEGFKYLPIFNSRNVILKNKYIRIFINYLKAFYYSLFKFKNNDIVVLQYPLYTIYGSKKRFYSTLFCHFKGKLILLVHDINYLRGNEDTESEPELRYLLEKSDSVIIHTENMKQRIIKDFSLDRKKIYVLNLFDYLTDEKPRISNGTGKTIIFAGNLEKGGFINKISEIKDNDIKFNLYGVYDNNILLGRNCFYKGCFTPENISYIKGDWGLVWDGDSIDTCSGNMGEYLRLNSSHKTSLYLAAGKPVIVWKESGIANYIIRNNLGIAVDSLNEISDVIKNISIEKKKLILENVTNISKNLRNGNNLDTIIYKILNTYGC